MALNLGRLDGTNGFQIVGIDEHDESGRWVAGAGDVNGDGLDDLIVGAPYADRGGRDDVGASYVVFGSAERFDASLNLADLDGANGFRLDGINRYDRSGSSVASAGDVNGDGLDDLIIGGIWDFYSANSGGRSYVVFGSTSRFAPSLDLASLDDEDGFRLDGIDLDSFYDSNFSVAGAGDVNGDGLDDLIIGADGANYYAGESYVVFGSPTGFPPSFDLAALNGANGFRLPGVEERGRSGGSVAGAGDVNGDGVDDLIIGASTAGLGGASYVVFGSSAGFAASLDLTDLDGSNGFRLEGIDRYDFSGASVSGAGDVNGDGVDDLIVGAPGPWGYSDLAGESYVVFGSSAGFDASVDLADLDGANGFRIEGTDQYDQFGYSVAGAGDFNGDGFDDLIVGAREGSGGDYPFTYAGKSYVVFGSSAGFDARLDLASLNGANGIRIDGIDPDGGSGSSVAGAGDVNGDGLDDLIIGAPGAAVGRDEEAGESYVVFGFRTLIRGGPGSDDLAGTAFDDRMFGRAANDALDGGDGRDRLKGGGGDDRLDGGAGRDHVSGGRGDDRLIGGGGADVFVFRLDFGSDRVRDFDADPEGGQDRIDLRRLGVTEASFRDDVTISVRGGDTRVTVEGEGTIVCEDVSGEGGDRIGVADFLVLA